MRIIPLTTINNKIIKLIILILTIISYKTYNSKVNTPHNYYLAWISIKKIINIKSNSKHNKMIVLIKLKIIKNLITRVKPKIIITNTTKIRMMRA